MRAGAVQKIFDPCARLDLPESLPVDAISIEEGHRPIGFRFYSHIINIKARVGNRELVVTGEANSPELAQAKVRSELIERLALIASPNCAAADTSNGWAAHPMAEQAKLNAILELLERDAVLSQWYSATPFFRIPNAELPMAIQRWTTEELSRSEYPELVVLISTQGIGPSVSCILRNANGFGVSGHATRPSLSESIDAAVAEACRAAHMTLRRQWWGDTLKLKNGEPGRVDPGAHCVYYAYHEPFPKWIFGPELSWANANARWNLGMESVIQKIGEFDFQTVLEFPLCVGFAKHPLAFDLRWGSTSVDEVLHTSGAKRLGLSSINKETHVVS